MFAALISVMSKPVAIFVTFESVLDINWFAFVANKSKASSASLPPSVLTVSVSNAPSAGEVVVQEITIAPGGTTGWHSHPGPVVVVVKAGTLTYVRAVGGECIETPYPANTAFVDPGQGHAHTAFNFGAENLVLIATYFDVPVGGSARIDVPVVPAAC